MGTDTSKATARLATLLTIVLLARAAAAQTPPLAPRPAAPAAPAPVAPPLLLAPVDDGNARETQRRLSEILRGYPPSVGQVLALDPSLLSSQSYMASYPTLGTFIAQHPEVARDPSFFFGNGMRLRPLAGPPDANTSTARAVSDVMGMFMVIAIVITVATFFAWLARILLNFRRWRQTARVQNETHAKLLDRLTSSEELLAYLQSPAGARFMEGAPLPPDPQSPGAPVNRILWSVQAGIVFVFGGAALLSVGGPFGMLGIALGLGFITSAAVSYTLSRRLGLIVLPKIDA